MNISQLVKAIHRLLFSSAGFSIWLTVAGWSISANVIAGSSLVNVVENFVTSTLQDNLPVKTDILIAPQVSIPVGPASYNHYLDDCIRNPLCTDVLSVGHRGTIIWGPENTIIAFNAAITMGADGVEMDVRNTKNGVLVLMHDDTLDRTTNCSGAVSQKTWAEIKDCQVIPITPGIQRGRIPTFTGALRALKGRTVIDLDLNTSLLSRVASVIINEGMQNQVMVLTSSLNTAKFFGNNGIAVMARAVSYSGVLEFLKLSPKPVAIEVDVQLLPFVKNKVHSAHSRLFVDALGACDLIGASCYRQLVRSGVDIIQTDNLPKLVPFLQTVN